MIYQTYRQACEKLSSLTSIEYFFAKQVLAYIKLDNKSLNLESEIQLFHLLMKLQSAYNSGNSCLSIKNIANQKFWDKEDFVDKAEDKNAIEPKKKEGFKFASFEYLKALISNLKLGKKPAIVFEYDCLYINRLWLFENEIAENINTRVATIDIDIDKTKLKAQIDILFKEQKEIDIDWQRVAVTKSLLRNFSIISGGPGTGKTTTVAKLILALQYLQADIHTHKLDIQLVAPTGKAAQRLKESIANTKNIITNKNVDLSLLPTEAKTLHRFLGLRPNTNYIKYNNQNKSSCDVLIIDEASMVDINMFVYVIRAIKDDCKLILLGDVDQLPSVETGNILAEFAKACTKNEYSSDIANFIKDITGHSVTQSKDKYDFITFLQKSYRTESADILNLAKNIIQGDTTEVQSSNSIDYQTITDIEYDKSIEIFIKEITKKYFAEIAKAGSKEDALALLKKFRILVANRNISIGTVRLNHLVEKYLGKKSFTNYHGRPIMVVENNYTTGHFNGDVGIIWGEKAYFEDVEGNLRPLELVRLPKVETVYVMTIHKTQGSEFDNVAIILPKEYNRVLNRNLLYTGITRAKSKVYIRTTKQVWNDTVTASVMRDSNISQILLDNRNNIGAL